MSELIPAVLPDIADLVYAELFHDPPELQPMPEEKALIARLMGKRIEWPSWRHLKALIWW